MVPEPSGQLMFYQGDGKAFSTAQLSMGSGTSGLLVTEVKKQLKSADINTDLVIIDGSPGIGCPVIASLSGVDMVLIVAEPSISGISDMKRIISTAEKFNVKTAVCVNKYDTHLENTDKIIAFCQQANLPFVGRIPFDYNAVRAINNGLTIVDIDCASGEAVKEIYKKTLKLLFDNTGDSSRLFKIH
jgi:MinD superfamily P-loop ATPase